MLDYRNTVSFFSIFNLQLESHLKSTQTENTGLTRD